MATVGTRAPLHRLPAWQRLGVYGSGASLLLTGVVWLAVHYSIGAGAGELPHPIETWCIRLHGLAAFAALFMLGVLAAAHIPRGWRLSFQQGWPQQKSTGAMLCGTAALAVLTGYVLYYFAPESLRPAIGWMHAVIGALLAVLIASHRRGARRLSREACATDPPSTRPARRAPAHQRRHRRAATVPRSSSCRARHPIDRSCRCPTRRRS